MTRRLRIAVGQWAVARDPAASLGRAEELVRAAAAEGAQVVLLPELFEQPYFPRSQDERWFATATPVADNPAVARLATLAEQLQVVIPVSFFERDGPAYYNSVALVDADGRVLGVYRKSHIPDGPGYQEKFYFRPGDTGFCAWRTRYGTLGVGICWDQWFPECARAMALQGADVLLYPTAIGSEPADPGVDTREPWRRAMVGHAVSNAVVLAAANRTGDEAGQRFYGSSFICDQRGDTLAELDRDEEGFATADIDLEALRRYRAAWGFFRDRRTELYGPLAR